jgi:hypothetical protein
MSVSNNNPLGGLDLTAMNHPKTVPGPADPAALVLAYVEDCLRTPDGCHCLHRELDNLAQRMIGHRKAEMIAAILRCEID